MAKTLLIVESPSKAKTIGKYLGSTYKVVASVGHVRDLPKSKLGVDIDNNFEPQYIAIRGKGDLIKSLKKDAKEASKVYLATDPDREGEAISWHLANLLGIDLNKKCRVTFNEITKEKVKEAVKNPRTIDLKLVDAQQARRVLDRLVGYQISPILWKKIQFGLSAGRVQSAAVKLICDRENEINNFVPIEYWNIFSIFKEKKEFSLKVTEYKNEKISISNENEANEVEKNLANGEYVVNDIISKDKIRKPFAPFTTSTLQQDAANKLGFTTKKTMSVVQKLYEGVNIPGEGTVGLVTYIRTDSVRISDEAKAAAYKYIEEHYGKEYTAHNVYTNKKKDIQDAHEAIRPTRVFFSPDSIKDSLDKDQYNLYKLIWNRFIASQMAAAQFDTTTLEVKNGDYTLRATGSKRVFDGYQNVYSPNFDEDKDNFLPTLKKGEKLDSLKIEKEQKFTEPPSRYTEASLVKDLEEKNIGRPSTYAPIIATIVERKYVSRSKKVLVPTELGFIVTELMSNYFNEIVDIGFTAEMEDKLDDVEAKGIDWKKVVGDFYGPFSKELKIAEDEIERVQPSDKIAEGEFCEKCGKPMAIKSGRFGEFLACTGYPDCKTTRPIIKKVGVMCPDCGMELIARRSKSGKIFYGCSGYPSCKRAYWYKPTSKKCPLCGELLVEHRLKNTKLSCSNAKCNYTE